jgi:fructokinase
MTTFRIGIDLGGTKIEAAALDDRGAIHLRQRVPTPAGDYAGTIAAIAALVSRIEREIGAGASVGIAIPGTIVVATGLVKNANSVWLNGKPLGQDVVAALGRPVRFANDANCFALSEAVDDGAAAGSGTVFGVILGTGVGGGIAIGGRVLVGANGIAGEWGHNPLPAPRPDELADEWPGPPCYCGRSGCIETFLSGPGLAADHRRHGGATLDAAAIAAGAAAAISRAARRSTATRNDSPGRWPALLTFSIRTRSCSAAGCRACVICMTRCRGTGLAISSRARW